MIFQIISHASRISPFFRQMPVCQRATIKTARTHSSIAIPMRAVFFVPLSQASKSLAPTRQPVMMAFILQREILLFIQSHFAEKLTLKMLAEARKLLESTELSVTEIAFQVGFPNVSYFIRSFKEAYGTSPLKYRNRTTETGEKS